MNNEFNLIIDGMIAYPKSAKIKDGFPKNAASKLEVPPTEITNSQFLNNNFESKSG